MGITRSVTKSVDINVPVRKLFEFLADGENWPLWAIANMKSVKKRGDGWYDTITKFGEGKIKLHLDSEKGLLDHTWQDPQAQWTVPARAIPNGTGSTFLMTLFQPPQMSDEDFDKAMKDMDKEFARLKDILENQ